MEPDRVHKGLLSQVGSPGGPRGSPGVDFGRIFDDVGSYFVMILAWIFDLLQYLCLCICNAYFGV